MNAPAHPTNATPERVDPLSWVEAPLVVAGADSLAWDETADVVVVGVGAAGVTAAIQAAEDGADVIALDRFEGGGATAWSGGVYYGSDTRYQREAGIEDTPEDMFAYLQKELRGTVSDETLRRFCGESASNLDWLEAHGARFDGTLTDIKTYYPPAGYYLYYSGNERLPEYKAIARPAPRGHRAFADGAPRGNTGWALFAPLKDAAKAAGVRLITHAAVNRLVTDADGRVIGVEMLRIEDPGAVTRHDELYEEAKPAPFNHKRLARARTEVEALEARSGTRRLVRARRGVVLSTGGFEVNAKLLARECPIDWSKGLPIGVLGSDGSGMILGQSVGGDTRHVDQTFVGQRLVPPAAYLNGMLVGKAGRRMISEEAYLSTVGLVMAQQSGGRGWIVLDRTLMRRGLRDAMPDRQPSKQYAAAAMLNILFGGTRVSRTIKGLAGKLGVDPDALQQTVDRYNAAGAGTAADEFGKPRDYIHALERGPYFAINVSFDNRLQFVSVFTLGGLTVDEQTGLVLRADGTGISGLYAAGRTAVGLPSISYVSGMSIADCIFSGRRAGHNAASQSKEQD